MDISNNEIINSMNNLNQNIINILEVFRVANEEMKNNPSASLDLLNMKLDKIMDQHEKIADAIIALTEMVQGGKENILQIPKPMQYKPNLPIDIPKPNPLPIRNFPPQQNIPNYDEIPDLPEMELPDVPKMTKTEQLKPLNLSSGRTEIKPLGRPPKRP